MDEIDARYGAAFKALNNTLDKIKADHQRDRKLLAAYGELQAAVIGYVTMGPGCQCRPDWHCYHHQLQDALAAVDAAMPLAVEA